MHRVPDYICHFHFLKDIGKDLFGHDYASIRRHLKTHAVRSQLRSMAKELKKVIDAQPDASDCLHGYLESKLLHAPNRSLMPLVSAYLMVCWVLEAKQKSHGFGFPFDQPHFDFYLRLREAYPEFKRLKLKMIDHASLLSLRPISQTLADQALAGTALRMQEKVGVFEQLREAMRIAQPNSRNGLNDQGDPDISTIKKRVTDFRYCAAIIEQAGNNIAYRKMVKQIDKYWDKLFADPIEVVTKTGIVTVQPQRTNNILEQLFRYLKRKCRKRSGNPALSNSLKSMMTQTPLIKILTNPQYMDIILNGETTLAQRFAQIDIAQVRKAFAEEQTVTRRYPKRMAKVFKIPNLPSRLVKISSKEVASS